ncbi:MAG: prepilin-type N-terminal cleavage/methylation domain-containing protein [Alphaproteobacteria bacterium]|nr:prepilin-type N-terminal cleavage/methylation domain-containing protein [Alphaproteobacteria bacterium]
MTGGWNQLPHATYRRLESGFTLIEMAVVVIVIGLIILTVFPALNAARTSSQRSMTQANLQSLMQATAAYVQANGCLPCPALASAYGDSFGRVGTAAVDAPSAPACGACVKDLVNELTNEGIAPFKSLGLASNVARDGWGHWITMRVDPALTANFGVVPPTKPIACSCSLSNGSCTVGTTPPITTPTTCGCSLVNGICTPLAAGYSQQGLCAANLPTADRIRVRVPPSEEPQFAAVIFVSHGVSGYGSFSANSFFNLNNGSRLPNPRAQSCEASSGYGTCNSNGDVHFVDAPSVATGLDPYDNILAFAGRDALVSMTGQGSCQTTW